MLPPKQRPPIPTSLSSPKLNNFTFFPELPFELRLKIWRQAFPGPRVVKVNSYGMVNLDGYCFHAFCSASQLPIVLSVCQESRAEALRYYHPSFGMRYPSIPSIIYFNCDIDTLYFEFDSHQALNSQLLILALSDRYRQVDGRVSMKNVQSVAVSHRIGTMKLKILLGYLTRFEGLREFIVGAERESPPVTDEAVLEEAEESDESLSGIRNVLDDASENWKRMWSRERDGGGDEAIPDLKIMEVRG